MMREREGSPGHYSENIFSPSSTNAFFVGFTQGYIAKRMKAVKDNGKCKGLTTFVTEASSYRSLKDILLVVQ